MCSVRKSHIAVLGGGFTGLVCALRLLQAGYQVTVLESSANLGGLTTSYNFGPFIWDKFYHCILTSDASLISLLCELGLEAELRWVKTEVGLFSHGAMHKMTGMQDLIRFPHLTCLQKLRLAIGTFYISRIKDGKRLEQIPLRKWTAKIFGKAIHEQIWEPLFRCKLGEMRHEVSAAFLWGTLCRLSSTRGKGPAKQECLGYVQGGYDIVFRRLTQEIISLGGVVSAGVKVRSVSTSRESGKSERRVCIDIGRKELEFDGAVLTIPNKAVVACLNTSDHLYLDKLRHVNYLGMICMVLVLKKKLSPFYVTNVTEPVGFTGVIEMTNLIDPDLETNGYHLVYLPRYTSADDPLFKASDEELWKHHQPDLQRMFPELHASDIVGRFVFKEGVVQPIPTIEYSMIAPAIRTPVNGVYLANTAQIINSTLNNNVMVSIAETACAAIKRDLPVTVSYDAQFVPESTSQICCVQEF